MWRELAGIGIAGSPLVLGELAARRFGLKRELARKTVHVLAAAASASLALFLGRPAIAGIGALFFGVLLIVRRYRLVTALYDVDRRSYGELLFPLGVSAAALLGRTTTVYIGIMLVVGLADTAASLAGLRFGRHRLPGARSKSLEGSAAFFLAASVILLAAFHSYDVLGASLLLSAVEAYSSRGWDNLTVPLAGSLLLRAVT